MAGGGLVEVKTAENRPEIVNVLMFPIIHGCCVVNTDLPDMNEKFYFENKLNLVSSSFDI